MTAPAPAWTSGVSPSGGADTFVLFLFESPGSIPETVYTEMSVSATPYVETTVDATPWTELIL